MKNILVVYKKSLFELYRNSKDKEVQEYVQDPNHLVKLKLSHEAQQETLETVVENLQHLGYKPQIIYRASLTPIKEKDLVISVGGDGTFLEVAHYIHDLTPILGVNSNPHSSVGYFSCATKDNFTEIIQQLEYYPQTILQRLQITLDNKSLPELVLNDILISHKTPAAMTRYQMIVDDVEILNEKKEKGLRSSGLIICTPAGSTAWIYEMGGKVMPLTSTQMQYHERDQRHASFCFADNSIIIQSLTREGFLYIDGDHVKYPFGLDSRMEITLGQKLQVVGNLKKKRKKRALVL